MTRFSSSLLCIAMLTNMSLQLPFAQAQTPVATETIKPATQSLETLKKEADNAIRAKDWPQAVTLWQNYLRSQTTDAYGFRRLGYALSELKRYDEALTSYTKSTTLEPKNLNTWGGLCWTHILANQPLLARPKCQNAVDLEITSGNALINLGHSYLLLGDTTTADSWYRKSLLQTHSADDLQGKLDDFTLFIKNGWQVQDSIQAKAWFEKEGAIWLARVAPADKLLDDAKAAEEKSDSATAISLREKRLLLLIELFGEAHPRVNDAHIALGNTLNAFATTLYQKAQYQTAEPLYIKALAIAVKAEGAEHPSTGTSLNNLAELYRVMGQYAKAEQMFIRALAISEKANGAEHPNTGIHLHNLALLYEGMGQYAKAEPMYIRALAVSEKTNDAEHSSIGNRLNSLAEFYRFVGQYDKAEPLYVRAMAISEKSNGADHPTTANLMNNLALLYQARGQYAKAEFMFIRAIDISEKTKVDESPSRIGISLSNLALLYQSMGQLTKAEPLLLRAQVIIEKANDAGHHNSGIILNNLAVLYTAMGQYARAESFILRAFQISDAAGNPELSWEVLGNLRSFYMKDQPNLAIWYGKQAINTLQTVRATNTGLDKETQKSFLEKNESSYKSLADLLFAQGRLMEGQQVLAMLKESEYFDFLQRNSSTDPRQTQSNFTEQERPWSERYGKISSQLASIGKERDLLLKKSKETNATGSLSADDQTRKDKLDADMAVARQAYAAFMVELKQEFSKSASAERQQEFGEKNLNSLRALQGTLRDLGHGAVTLHYLMTDKRLWILLTTPTIQLKRESTISEAELNKLIGQYREAIANRSPNIKTLGKALYDILLGPVAEDLKQADAKTLMLSLDGSLRYLPMAALYDGEQYLAKRYSLALYTSAAKDKLKDKPQANWTLAGYGLTQKHEGFNALPAVKGELDGIMEGMKGQVKFDNDFTAKAFKAGLESEPSVVHLASHFVFAPGNETDSYLLLGDGKKLSLKEIKDGYEFVNLDLLTLSACETAVGGGKDANGREVEGFGALAQNQGAKGVIATLWPVADQSTGQFMQLLYGYRQQNPGMTKAQAMQKAQLAFIEGKVEPALAAVSRGAPKIAAAPAPVTTTDHPYYWAPFILMGNWL